MHETRNNCFGLNKRGTTLHQGKTGMQCHTINQVSTNAETYQQRTVPSIDFDFEHGVGLEVCETMGWQDFDLLKILLKNSGYNI